MERSWISQQFYKRLIRLVDEDLDYIEWFWHWYFRVMCQSFLQSSPFSPQQCVLQVAQPASTVASAHPEEPLYVNAKQYKR